MDLLCPSHGVGFQEPLRMLPREAKRGAGGRTLGFQVLTPVREVWSARLGKDEVEFKGKRRQQSRKQYVLLGCDPEAQNLS